MVRKEMKKMEGKEAACHSDMMESVVESSVEHENTHMTFCKKKKVKDLIGVNFSKGELY